MGTVAFSTAIANQSKLTTLFTFTEVKVYCKQQQSLTWLVVSIGIILRNQITIEILKLRKLSFLCAICRLRQLFINLLLQQYRASLSQKCIIFVKGKVRVDEVYSSFRYCVP